MTLAEHPVQPLQRWESPSHAVFVIEKTSIDEDGRVIASCRVNDSDTNKETIPAENIARHYRLLYNPTPPQLNPKRTNPWKTKN